MTIERPPCVLTIAGSDSSGGAGIQADIKTISATGSYAASVLTAITAQNTQGVQAIHALPHEMVSAQLDSVFTDLNIKAVKIGMLHNENIIKVVAQALKKYQPQHVILDPVMIAKNGARLLADDAVAALQTLLFAKATLITPNLHEAETILQKSILDSDQQTEAANLIAHKFATHVLVKGGHMNSEQSSDVLYDYEHARAHWFCDRRIDSLHTHGTGCSLSSAIASYLARDLPLNAAIAKAKSYITQAILHGRTLQIGAGKGPLHHFYFLEPI